MVIVMQEGARDEQHQRVIDRLVAMGFDIHRSTGATHTVLGAVGIKTDFDPRDIELLDGVREVVRITQPYKLASRHFRPEGTIVDVGKGVRSEERRVGKECRSRWRPGHSKKKRKAKRSRETTEKTTIR